MRNSHVVSQSLYLEASRKEKSVPDPRGGLRSFPQSGLPSSRNNSGLGRTQEEYTQRERSHRGLKKHSTIFTCSKKEGRKYKAGLPLFPKGQSKLLAWILQSLPSTKISLP